MITPHDFLDQAKDLLAINPSTEVNRRSAISRSYYYLFHETLDYLERTHRSNLAQGITNYLIQHGDNSFDPTRINAIDRSYLQTRKVNLHAVIPHVLRNLQKRNEGRDFAGLREERNHADYELDIVFSSTDSINVVNRIEALAITIQT